MIISTHQPDYIPYLGYFYKMKKSDIFVFLDDVQFSNTGMHNWNKIKGTQGEIKLKVPVKHHWKDLINQVISKDELEWKSKHLMVLQHEYGRARYFHTIYPEFTDLLMRDYQNIAEMNIAINTWIAGKFGFDTKFVRSSSLLISSVREERILDIVSCLNGDVYLSGTGAATYQVEEHFQKRGIQLIYTDYKPIQYEQLWPNAGFVPYMSIMDYVFNCGFDWESVEKKLQREFN